MNNIFTKHRAKTAKFAKTTTAKTTAAKTTAAKTTAAKTTAAKTSAAKTSAAKTSAAKTSAKDSISMTLQQLFKLLLDDVKLLKETATEKRDGLKKQFITKYQDSLNEQMTEQSWTGNLFIFWNIIWRFDIGDFNEGWRLAKLGFERGLTSDKIFKRTFATIIADIIFEQAQSAYENDKDPSPILQEMLLMIEAPNSLNIHPVVHSKILRLQGIIITSDRQARLALTYFEKATELAPKIGLKGRIDKLKKQLTTDTTDTDTQE